MMIEEILLGAVANWLWVYAKDLLGPRNKDKWTDFELHSHEGERLLIEIMAKPPNDIVLNNLAQKLVTDSDAAAHFILITPDEPSPNEKERFMRAFGAVPNQTQWLALRDLPSLLNKPSPGSWDSPQTLSDLQTNALIKGLEEYRLAPVGAAPYVAQPPTSELEALTRQFPYDLIAQLDSSQPLESQLSLGSRWENATIVFSDIKNFSSLVTASRPDDLREAMGQYYQQARQAVFDHGGMLDKFIGDAVLAVFGYPMPKREAACDAIRFAHTLTAIGRNVMTSWQAELNAVIETGTRIGIATGDIWPINIGQTRIEISLLGDTINLAARLEKNCMVDKLLIDNRTHTAVLRVDEAFVMGLNLQQIVIPAADAKGQAFSIRAWAQP